MQGYREGGGSINLAYFFETFMLYLQGRLTRHRIARVLQDISMQADTEVFKNQIYLILTRDPKVEDKVFVQNIQDFIWLSLKTVVLDESERPPRLVP